MHKSFAVFGFALHKMRKRSVLKVILIFVSIFLIEYHNRNASKLLEISLSETFENIYKIKLRFDNDARKEQLTRLLWQARNLLFTIFSFFFQIISFTFRQKVFPARPRFFLSLSDSF